MSNDASLKLKKKLRGGRALFEFVEELRAIDDELSSRGIPYEKIYNEVENGIDYIFFTSIFDTNDLRRMETKYLQVRHNQLVKKIDELGGVHDER